MGTLLELAARLQSEGALASLFSTIVKATVILAIARLVIAALPRASAATKHLIATIALVAVVILPALSLLPAWHLGVTKPATSFSKPAPADVKSGGRSKGVGALDAEEPLSLGTAINVVRSSGVVPEEPLTVATRAVNLTKATWQGLIVLLVRGVAIFFLAQMLLGMVGVAYVARRAEEMTDDNALQEVDRARDQLALRRDVRLLRSGRISVPVVWGFFKPVLMLPADCVMWPQERLRVVLLHELAHLKRFDGITLLVTRIAASLYWFHPLAWSLESAGRSACERACDDLVLASGTKASDYADHLLAIARSMPSFDPFRSVTLAMSRKSQLEGRLLSILNNDVARRVLNSRFVGIALVATLIVVIPISTVRLIAEPQKPAPKPQVVQNTDSEITVTPDVDAITDYFVAKLGKYDKRADRFAREPKNGEEWYQRGYDYYHADRYPEAAAAFEKAATLGYRADAALYNAACSFALIDDHDRALQYLGRAISAGWDDFDKIADDSDLDPIRSDARFAQVVNHSKSEVATRRVTEAVERYAELQSSDEKDGDDWFDAGLDLLRLRRFDESIDAFNRAAATGAKPGTSFYNIACAYSLKGDSTRALDYLAKAIENGFGDGDKLESDPDLRGVRGQSAFAALQERAEELEMRHAEGDDDEPENWRGVAAYHRSIAQKYPTSGRAWFNLGYTSLQARDLPTAVDAFQRAVDLGYRTGTSSYNVACAYAVKGDRDAAFAWLDKARAAGFDLGDYLDDDDDLDSLHNDPRYAKLQADVEREEETDHRHDKINVPHALKKIAKAIEKM